MTDVSAEQLAKIYVKIREKRRELAKQDEELKEQLDTVAAQLLEIHRDHCRRTAGKEDNL